MRSYVKLFAPVVMAIIIGSMTVAFSQQQDGERKGNRPLPPPPPGFGGGSGVSPEMLDELGLTPDQQLRIRELIANSQSSIEPLMVKAHQAQTRLRDLAAPESFDETAARILIAERNNAQAEAELIRMRTDAAIFNLLSAEQLAKLESIKDSQRDRPGRGPRRPAQPREQ